MAFWWTPSLFPLSGLTSVAVCQLLVLLWLAGDALLIEQGSTPIGQKAQGGQEGIDLSVVLEDQLIPIVCASTDSLMCLIWYSLFLLGQDKSLSHHFPLCATNQIKSKGMTACRGFLPRLWLTDHNKKRPSIWGVFAECCSFQGCYHDNARSGHKHPL